VDNERRHLIAELRSALQMSMSANSAAFGFSIAITGALAAVGHEHGSPSAIDVLLFGAGGVAAFTLLDLAATEGLKLSVRRDPDDVTIHATAFGFVSVGAAIGIAIAAADLVHGIVAWPLASFLAGGAYILLVALEMALTSRLEGRDDAT
jgi:hypothetical protein